LARKWKYENHFEYVAIPAYIAKTKAVKFQEIAPANIQNSDYKPQDPRFSNSTLNEIHNKSSEQLNKRHIGINNNLQKMQPKTDLSMLSARKY